MTPAMAREARTEEMRSRCAAFLSSEFVCNRVAPMIGEKGASGASVQIVRSHGSRVTLRYSFASGTVVYAKAYRGSAGRRRHNILRALWDAGFGDGGNLRVPEPLGFLEDANLVLMREARGEPLALSDSPLETAVARVRAAARWLLALHGAKLSGLDPEGPCERWKILEESDYPAAAAAAHPELCPALLEFSRKVRDLAPSAVAQDVVLAPTHGQFIPSVLLADSAAMTAIDLDTVSLSDPAKDVATFVSRVKFRKLFNARVAPARAGRLAAEFLDEYGGPASRNLANLPYYAALYCLREFAAFVSGSDPDRTALDRAERLCRAELDRLSPNGARPNLSVRDSGSAEICAALRASGFEHPSPFRVAEAAGGVEGVPLPALLNTPQALAACRGAARWLAALHRSEVRVGSPEPEWVSIQLFRIPETLIEACARAPDRSRVLIETVYRLNHRLEKLPAASRIAQTHGRFLPEHVFVAKGVTTAVCLQHSCPADPAKDVAGFVVDLRSRGFDRECDTELAGRAANAFLDEYLSHNPEIEARVGCYSACYLTLRLLERTRLGLPAGDFDCDCSSGRSGASFEPRQRRAGASDHVC